MEIDQDSLAIEKVLEDHYFKGIYEGDINALSDIYHPGTLLFGDVKGQPYAKTLGGVSRWGCPSPKPKGFWQAF